MFLVAAQVLEVFHMVGGLLDVILWRCVSLRLQSDGSVNTAVDITINISELLWQIARVTLEDNLIIVASLHQFTVIELLVDIVRVLLHELRQTLLEMGMEGTWVDEQSALQDLFSQPILGNHAFDGGLKDEFWLFLKHVLHRGCSQMANVASIVAVDFLRGLSSSHILLFRVDNNNEVAINTTFSCNVCWLMLTPQVLRSKTSDATKGHPLSIEQVPGLSFVLYGAVHALRVDVGFSANQSSVHKCVVKMIHSVTNVFIELDARVLGLRFERFINFRCSLSHLLVLVNRVITFLASESGELKFLLFLNVISLDLLGTEGLERVALPCGVDRNHLC